MDGDRDDVDGDDVDHKHHLRRKDLERTVIVMLLKMMVGTVWMVLVISEDVDDDHDVDYKQHLRWPFLREDLERTVYSDDVDDGDVVLVIREDDNDYKHHLMRPSQGVTNLLLPDDDDDDGPDIDDDDDDVDYKHHLSRSSPGDSFVAQTCSSPVSDISLMLLSRARA